MLGYELRVVLGGKAAFDGRSPKMLANDNPSREQELFEHIVEREMTDGVPE